MSYIVRVTLSLGEKTVFKTDVVMKAPSKAQAMIKSLGRMISMNDGLIEFDTAKAELLGSS